MSEEKDLEYLQNKATVFSIIRNNQEKPHKKILAKIWEELPDLSRDMPWHS